MPREAPPEGRTTYTIMPSPVAKWSARTLEGVTGETLGASTVQKPEISNIEVLEHTADTNKIYDVFCERRPRATPRGQD